MQKIYACPFFYSFKLRLPGKTIFLHIGKGRFNQSIFTSKKKVETRFRRKDSFLEKLKKEFLGARLIEVSLFNGFNIFSFNQASLSKKLIVSYRNNLMFCGLILPFGRKELEKYLIYKRKPISRVYKSDFSLESFLKKEIAKLPELVTEKIAEENIDPNYLTKNYEAKIQRKNIKKSKLKLTRIKTDIKKLESFLELKNELILHNKIDSYIDENGNFNHSGIKIKKLPENYYKARELLFNKIKRIENAIKIQKNRLIRELESLENNKSEISIKEYVFPVSRKIEESKNKSKISFTPIPLGDFGEFTIGKNAKENDELRTKWARPDDIWFHLKDLPGPHLFLRLKNNIFLSVDILERVSQEFRVLNGNRSEINIIYTKVKYLKKVSGSQGQVIPRKEKYYRSTL